MSQQRLVIITDDIDGTEGANTYKFGWQNATYEIDLSDENRDEFLRVLQPYIDVARRTGGSPSARRSAQTDRATAIRAWASANGHHVGDRGRIPARIVEAYEGRDR